MKKGRKMEMLYFGKFIFPDNKKTKEKKNNK